MWFSYDIIIIRTIIYCINLLTDNVSTVVSVATHFTFNYYNKIKNNKTKQK